MYGAIVAAGIFIASWFAEQICIYKKKDPKLIWDALLWALVFGLIGARLFHVIDFWFYYSQDPIAIFKIWQGGLGIIGALLGGLAGVLLFARRRGLGTKGALWLLDLAGLSLPLGQAIGRWANYFNQELYGLPSKLPWSIYIRPEKRVMGFKDYSSYHPLFLYESLGSLLIFIFIFLVHNNSNLLKKLKIKLVDGDVFLLYLTCYGFLRFVLEPLRIVHWEVFGINLVQTLSLLPLFISLTVIIKRWKKRSNKLNHRNQR